MRLRIYTTIPALLLFSTAFGQVSGKELIVPVPFDSAGNKYAYTAVVATDGISKEKMFYRAEGWCAGYFGIRNFFDRDEKHGIIMIRSSFPVTAIPLETISSIVESDIHFTLSITVKDGRYKLVITDFYVSSSSAGTTEDTSLETYVYSAKNYSISIGKKGMFTITNQILENMDIKCRQIMKDVEKMMKSQDADAGW